MIWVFFLCIGVVVAAYAAAVLLGRVSAQPLPPPTHTRPLVALPDRAHAADIDDLHFDTAFRGYRMDQVDEVLDQLQARLASYEKRFAELRGRASGPATGELAPVSVSAPVAVPDRAETAAVVIPEAEAEGADRP